MYQENIKKSLWSDYGKIKQNELLQDEECCPTEEIPYRGSTFNVGLKNTTTIHIVEMLCQQKKVSSRSFLDLGTINEKQWKKTQKRSLKYKLWTYLRI